MKLIRADGGEDLLDYDIQGGGGTDFECCWEYMKEHNITPKKFIMFTDGYPLVVGVMQIIVKLFSLYMVHDKNTKAPFGVTAYYEEAA